MAAIAGACGISKALLYHYYANKEQLLFDMLKEHFEELEATVVAADEPRLATARGACAAWFARCSTPIVGADAEHKIQINELSTLPLAPAGPAEGLRARAGRDVRRACCAGINPGDRPRQSLLKPVTMSLFGMLNWHYMWFRPGGRSSRASTPTSSPG